MNKREKEQVTRALNALIRAGISPADADALRRISMALHRWHERECGLDHGCIERDETTQKPLWRNSYTMSATPIADKEAGALKRLAAIMARYPKLRAYVQDDPRGCALYILRPEDAPKGQEDGQYTNGLAIF